MHGKLKNKVGRSDLFSKKYIWDDGENMAKIGEFPYNIEQEGNHGWLWNAHLNRSPVGTLLSIVE